MSLSEFEEAWSAEPSPVDRHRNARQVGEAILSEVCGALEMVPPVTVSPTDSIRRAVDVMVGSCVGYVLVVSSGRLVGIFTERDLMKRVAHIGYPQDRPVGEVMTPDPAVLPLTAPVVFVLNRMVDGGYRHVPIVDDAGRPLGVLSVRNVVEWVVSHVREEVLNLPPRVRESYPPTLDGG